MIDLSKNKYDKCMNIFEKGIVNLALKRSRIVQFILFLFFFAINIHALDQREYAEAKLFTLEMKNTTLGKVFETIESNSQFVFFYYDGLVDMNEKVSVNVKGQTLDKILSQLLENTNLTYRIEDKQITIVKKNQYSQKTLSEKNGFKIKGTVKDESGIPLIGVNIMVKATSIGTVTDMDGQFEITIPEVNASLLISYIGYTPQAITIKNDTPLKIVLKENNQLLDEVVVVGYGSQKKLSVTSAVSSIKTDDLQQSPVASLSNALAGRLPGLVTIQNSGEPGADGSNIWIRGQATYNGSTAPMIMVDGVERAMNDLDANEIEDITILKDASATAVYGVRGANGVILVTTKRGKVEKPRVTASFQYGIQSPTRLPEYMSSYDALTLYAEGLDNDGFSRGIYTDDYIAKFADRTKPAYAYLYPDVDWLDTMLKDQSYMTQANLNVTGGTSLARYFVSASYMRQNGLYNFDDSIEEYDFQARTERYNFRTNVDLDLTRDLSMEVNIAGTIRDRNYPGGVVAKDLFSRLKKTPSWIYPVMNPDGSVAGTREYPDNPYGYLTQRGYKRNFNTDLQATAGFKLDMPWITKGLSARARMSFDMSNFRDVTRTKSPSIYEFVIDPEELDLEKGSYVQHIEGTAGNRLGYTVGANGSRKVLFEGFINYDRTFKLHTVKGLFLYNQGEDMYAIASGDANAIEGLPRRRQGIAGRFNYSYDNRYFVEANFAWNGSEQFAKGHRFGFFPSASASWVASNEAFFKETVPVINLLKLRASVGKVGNDQNSARFLYQSRWQTTDGYTFGKYLNGDGYGGIQEDLTGNIYTSWETAMKYNLGLDLGLWNNSFRIEADVFYENRTNILDQPQDLPGIYGFNAFPRINAGRVSNKGFEIVLEHQKQFKKQGYFVKGNFSYNRNKIEEMLEPAKVGREYQRRTGTRLGEKYGLIALGLFESYEDIANSPKQTWVGESEMRPGDIKYKDINDDKKIDALDETYLGKVGIPPVMFGLSLGYNYKGFDVSVLFQGALGGDIWVNGDEVYPFNKINNVLEDVKGNYFNLETNPDIHAKYPRMTSNANNNNYRNSSFWLKSNDYLRLKNVELGYSFPKMLMSRIGMEKVRVYVTGLNLYTWDYLKIFDPEIADGNGTYPQQMVVNFGVSLTY